MDLIVVSLLAYFTTSTCDLVTCEMTVILAIVPRILQIVKVLVHIKIYVYGIETDQGLIMINELGHL